MERTAADIRAELAEIDSELRDMVGSPDFSVSGMSVDEQQMHGRLMQRKADLELALGVIANGGTSEQNASNTPRTGTAGGW